MDHVDIEAQALVARYHQGALAPELEAEFEEHFLGCAECQAELAGNRSLQRGLKAMAAEDLAAIQVGVLAALLRRRGTRLGLLAAGVLLAATPAVWLLRERNGLRAEVRAAGDRAAALERRVAEGERVAAETRQALEARLAELAATAGRLTSPLADLPVFLLRTLRDPGVPPTTIDRAKLGDHLGLAVDVGEGPPATGYRARLVGPDGSESWARDGLRQNELEVVLVTFPSSFLSDGDHRLDVEGFRGDGSTFPVGRFAFRIVGSGPS